jgi:hypothetical protein
VNEFDCQTNGGGPLEQPASNTASSARLMAA